VRSIEKSFVVVNRIYVIGRSRSNKTRQRCIVGSIIKPCTEARFISKDRDFIQRYRNRVKTYLTIVDLICTTIWQYWISLMQPFPPTV
jgi:hypothetical protein